MATKRAKRLEKYLGSRLCWETQSGQWSCKADGCGFYTFSKQNHCSACGAKMPKKMERDPRVLEDLEAAIAYALQESA